MQETRSATAAFGLEQLAALPLLVLVLAAAFIASGAQAQATQPLPTDAWPSGPIAIVPVDSSNSDTATKVTGALEVSGGRAIIGSNGEVTSGSTTTEVTLPHRGVLRVCASTSVRLAADSSVPAGEAPGLMMTLNQGAIEASFAIGRNSDILLTPDFRILIGGPGAADVKVRLGQHGDTCVDNGAAAAQAAPDSPATPAPYVLVTSVFDGSIYRVQPGQRVMFQHGSIKEVVDQEKEPCGCPPPPRPNANDFPLAQSAGLAPLPPPAPPASTPANAPPAATGAFVHLSAPNPEPAPAVAPATPPTPPATAPTPAPAPKLAAPKQGFFTRMGHFFRRIFGGG